MRQRLPAGRVSGWARARESGQRARRPGEEYNPGPPTAPRQAATVILLRGGARDARGAARQAHAAGALHGRRVGVSRRRRRRGRGRRRRGAPRAPPIRELREEAAIELDGPGRAREVLALDHPRAGRRSASTRTSSSPRCRPGRSRRSTARRCVDLGWFTPQAALEAHARRARSCWCSRRSSTSSSWATSRRSTSCWTTRAGARCCRSSRAWCRGRGRARSCSRRARLLSRG